MWSNPPSVCVHITALGKSWQFLKKLSIHLSSGPIISLLDICSREISAKMCTGMFMVVLCARAPNWKHPKRLFSGRMNKQGNKVGYLRTVKYYAATKRSELLITHYTMAGFQNKDAKWKKPDQKKSVALWFCLHETVENAQESRGKESRSVVPGDKGG